MKIKSIFCIALFLFVLVSMTGTYAKTINVGTSSFTVPEGFIVYSADED